jgi:monoterpene epsilon-lactone hydrolase
MSKQQAAELAGILRQGRLDLNADVVSLRTAFNQVMSYVPVAEGVVQKPVSVGGVDAIEVTIRDVDAARVILYMHGGVYVIGSASTSVPLVSELARRAQAKVVTLDYRLAPEHPFPAAIDDTKAAYQALLDGGHEPERIAFAGDSAGGGLAVATLLALREAGVPLPSCAYLMSPYADLTLSGDTLETKASVDVTLTPDGLRLRVDDYTGDVDPADPLISPIFGDLHDLPPLLIHVGSNEILLSDAVRLAGRAATDDVPVTLEVTPGVPHVFQGFAAALDEADQALTRAATFIKERARAAQAVPTT